MAQQPSQPISVFFSYSREDLDLRNKLGKHLRSLERQGVITSWYDRQIQAGSEWKEEIEHHIHTADIILLLISSDFIDSKYCYEIEMPQAIDRHDAGEACVVPILLRPVEGWKYLPFAKLQVYPSGGKPVTDWHNSDNAYVDIVQGIRGAVDQLLEKRQQQIQAFETWLTTIALPLTATDQPQLSQWQKLTGLTDAAMTEKMEAAQTDRQQQEQARMAAAQRQEQERLKAEQEAREAEERRQTEQEAKRQAEQRQREQAERDRLAEQQRQIERDRLRLERERQIASPAQPKSFTLYATKRKLFGSGDRVPIEMIAIPGGKFWMGSPDGVGLDDERPRHEVTIAPFSMSKYPVTQAQYQAVMDKNPSRFKGENRPVEQVTWWDAIAFCEALSKMCDRKVTLPSESQWEYACRSGTETSFYFGETISAEQVNHAANRNGTSDVGNFPPNKFGLYDMHGNVWEWCLDHWHKNYQGSPIDGSAWLTNDKNARRLLRGGSWYLNPDRCRSACRFSRSPDDRYHHFGFRLVCV